MRSVSVVGTEPCVCLVRIQPTALARSWCAVNSIQGINLEVRFAVGDVAGPLSGEARRELATLSRSPSAELDRDSVVAIVGGSAVGVIQIRVGPTCPTEYLGALPAREAHVHKVAFADGCWGHLPALVGGAARRVHERHGLALQWSINREHARWDESCRAAIESGMTLFQEKAGFFWDESHLPKLGPIQFRYQSIGDIGQDEYRRILTRCGADSLDRNDAWYRSCAGADNWGRAFMGYYNPEHADTWLVGYDASDEPVGFVAVAPFVAEGSATIVYVGVLPEQRGRGVVDDLLRSAAAAARNAGFTQMLCDADVLNHPMCEAFVRNGHRTDRRPWHKWHFRSQRT